MKGAKHMISRLRWDTSFDLKDRAAELQNRLSSWSRIKMPAEIADVFEKMCPAEQLWRFDKMVIDLGTVDYANLEAELSGKLREALAKKLTELLNLQNNDSNIVILDLSRSGIELITHFLMQGFIPWNNDAESETIDQLIGRQLSENRGHMIRTIRDIGASHQHARRRMAWQLNEASITGIIAALEPANHEAVTGFADEMTRIQSDQSIVQGALPEFRKNLWYWILNFLLTERGTTFNKIAFIKSSIAQMAAQYNVSYEELVSLIEKAVKQVEQRQPVKADIIVVLNILVKENKQAGGKRQPGKQGQKDNWALLEKHLLKPGAVKKPVSSAELNDLITALSQQDSERLRQLMIALNTDQRSIHTLAGKLNETSFEALVNLYAGTDTTVTSQAIGLLYGILREAIPAFEKRSLWEAVLMSASKKNATPGSGDKFFSHLIEQLSTETGLSRLALLELMMNTQISASQRSIVSLPVYVALNAAFAAEIAASDTITTRQRFTELLKSFARQIGNPQDKSLFLSLKRVMTKYMLSSPENALAVFRSYADKSQLQALLVYLLNDHTEELLTKHVNEATDSAATSIREIITRFQHDRELSDVIHWINERLPALTLQADIFHSDAAEQRLIEFLFNGLNDDMPARLQKQFESLIARFLAYDNTGASPIPAALLRKLQQKPAGAKRKNVLQKTPLPVINSKPDNQAADHNKYYRLSNGSKLSPDQLFKLAEDLFTKNDDSRFEEIITIAAENDAVRTLAMIKKLSVTGAMIKAFDRSTSFRQFSKIIAIGSRGAIYDALTTINILYDVLLDIVPGVIDESVRHAFWKQLLQVIKTGRLSYAGLARLIQISLHQLARDTYADSEMIIQAIEQRHIQLNAPLRTALIKYTPAFASLTAKKQGKAEQKLQDTGRKGLLYELCKDVITGRRVPSWFSDGELRTAGQLLAAIIEYQPAYAAMVLKRELVSERQMVWLSRTVDFKSLTRSISILEKGHQSVLEDLYFIYTLFGKATLCGIPATELQYTVFKKLIRAWTENNWKIVSAGNIWTELLWTLSTNHSITVNDLIQYVGHSGAYLPPSLKISFSEFSRAGERPTVNVKKQLLPEPIKKQSYEKQPPVIMAESIPVKNAGLVLINGYLQVLFDRLELTRNRSFIDIVCQMQAVHYLQYVATGLSITHEILLPLNKVMCGLPLSFPVTDGVEISAQNKDIIEGLIKAMIGHWPSVGDSSVYGFRGNWMVRDGLLTEREDKWELVVEKRAYDILLHKSPFSFSIIKYPWMDKPLHVNWPY